MAVKQTLNQFCPSCGERHIRIEDESAWWRPCKCPGAPGPADPPRKLLLRSIIIKTPERIPSSNRITIGPYTISVFKHGGFFMAHESGEGMQVHGHRLVELIDEFYKRTF